jgi:GNAT superfamily N-acetyltransferase
MVMVRRIESEEAQARVAALGEILIDVVDGGASVHFLAPLARPDAESFWRRVVAAVGRRERLLMGAFDGDELVGTAQLLLDTPPNQPHRAEVAKVMVHRRARRRGIAKKLMAAIEVEARALGRTLLTLDTVAGSPAEHLYRANGWIHVGNIPRYALGPDGTALLPTSILYKELL